MPKSYYIRVCALFSAILLICNIIATDTSFAGFVAIEKYNPTWLGSCGTQYKYTKEQCKNLGKTQSSDMCGNKSSSCVCDSKYTFTEDNCAAPKKLGGEQCGGKYTACVCDAKYKFTAQQCTDDNKIPFGEPCGDKYEACVCDTSVYKETKATCELDNKIVDKTQMCDNNSKACVCDSKYEFTEEECKAENKIPFGEACDNRYEACVCDSNIYNLEACPANADCNKCSDTNGSKFTFANCKDGYTQTTAEDGTISCTGMCEVTNILKTVNSAGEITEVHLSSEWIDLGTIFDKDTKDDKLTSHTRIKEADLNSKGFIYREKQASSCSKSKYVVSCGYGRFGHYYGRGYVQCYECKDEDKYDSLLTSIGRYSYFDEALKYLNIASDFNSLPNSYRGHYWRQFKSYPTECPEGAECNKVNHLCALGEDRYEIDACSNSTPLLWDVDNNIDLGNASYASPDRPTTLKDFYAMEDKPTVKCCSADTSEYILVECPLFAYCDYSECNGKYRFRECIKGYELSNNQCKKIPNVANTNSNTSTGGGGSYCGYGSESACVAACRRACPFENSPSKECSTSYSFCNNYCAYTSVTATSNANCYPSAYISGCQICNGNYKTTYPTINCNAICKNP